MTLKSNGKLKLLRDLEHVKFNSTMHYLKVYMGERENNIQNYNNVREWKEIVCCGGLYTRT